MSRRTPLRRVAFATACAAATAWIAAGALTRSWARSVFVISAPERYR